MDFRAKRGLDKRVYLGLAGCSWISRHHNLIITGTTGVGESYLACPRVKGMPRGLTIYYRFSDFIRELTNSVVDGSYPKLAAKLAKRDLFIIDD